MSATISIIGEVMLELLPKGNDSYALGVAGDTYNTAVALSKLGASVKYLTGLGSDRYSDKIAHALHHHGIGTAGVYRSEERQPGLYIIDNDEHGERYFSYWRKDSAASYVLKNVDVFNALLPVLQASEYVYWSGITLALMSDSVKNAMFDFLSGYRASGGKVVFDSNYRPQLWAGQTHIATHYRSAIAHSDYYLPSLDDELCLNQGGSVATVLKNHRDHKHCCCVMTAGNKVFISQGDKQHHIAIQLAERPIDTTGAGDAFNAAFIHALMRGQPIETAIHTGHSLANSVVSIRGALLSDDDWHKYLASTHTASTLITSP